ncbi:MAG: VIT1/CCC1 transporter family protein, partial [Candidatus Lokiarchaeota archaeon]
LTVLGTLLGSLIFLLRGNSPSSAYIVSIGLSTSIAMFVSGFSGSYLSERAEQRKIKAELDKAMANFEEKLELSEEEKSSHQEEIKKHMITPISFDKQKSKIRIKKEKEKKKTLHEKAEGFANKIVSTVNGSAPFFGGLVPLIPFFFVPYPNFFTFIFSFSIVFGMVIFLGIFLGYIARESMIKNVLHMALASAITIIISMITLILTPSSPIS